MTPRQHLCYALGELAYALAKSDGKVDRKERLLVHEIMSDELSYDDFNYELGEIVFQMVDKQKKDVESVYKDALEHIKIHKKAFEPELKLIFLRTLEKIEHAVPPIPKEKKELMHRFREDIKMLN
jgi:hypothetical protein